MNKRVIYYISFLLICWSLFSKPVASKTPHFTEKDIVVDQNTAIVPTKFPSNFKEKYRSRDFVYEVKITDKGFWDRLKEWFIYWFKKIFGLSNMDVSSRYVTIIFRVIAGLIVAYVVYLIVKIILNKEGQWIFGKSTTKKIYEDEEIEKNLKNVDFDSLIKQTLKEQNHRLVIRYYYLWVLKNLSEKDIIHWNSEKTNSDYLYEIKNPSLKEEFQYLSYLYNYIWYGEFELTESTFLHAKNAFEKSLITIQNE